MHNVAEHATKHTMTQAYYITGTDTEIGKTHVSCALLALSAALILLRLVSGPRAPDRVVAIDALTMIAIAVIAVGSFAACFIHILRRCRGLFASSARPSTT